MHPYLQLEKGSRYVPHLIGGQWTTLGDAPHQNQSLVRGVSPYTGAEIFTIQSANAGLVDQAVQSALHAACEWSAAPHKERARVLFSLRAELLKNLKDISAVISFESGKTIAEAEAGLMKGVEVLEFALSLQNLDAGGRMEVSRGIFCESRRVPLGVVAGITPFNFPAMVPFWMMPIAIACGNAFIWKPSDKVPLTSEWIGRAWMNAGLPKGVLTILQGQVETVNAILEHPSIRAIGFVGSTAVAREIYKKGCSQGKRVLALGGAKNHILLLPDADPEIAGQGIADSFTGCAGQRCMAASVLLAVGNVDSILERIIQKASTTCAGQNMGAVISKSQLEFLNQAIERAVQQGAKVVLDGRNPKVPDEYKNGNWLGPTILDHVQPGSEAATKELFGPILSIVRCKDIEQALKIDSDSSYGNATSVFTQNGAWADLVAERSQSGMIGINIGVPVPREPFSFGGTFESKFGHGDITGMQGVDFWTDLKKITTKWTKPKTLNWMG